MIMINPVDAVPGSDTTERVSISTGGAQADGVGCINPSISSDGRYVAFASPATNLVAGDTNAKADIFVRDRQDNTLERVSVSSAGVQSDDDSYYPSISADGRYVAFASIATNLVAGDTNGATDIFVHDRQMGQTTRVSVDSAGTEADFLSDRPFISADGRYVVFDSSATNLVAGDTNTRDDIFVHDRDADGDGIFDEAGAISTTRASISSAGAEGGGNSYYSTISADGRYVTFQSASTNLVAGDTNARADIFVHDRDADDDGIFDEAGAVATTRVNVSTSGTQANNGSFYSSISADGRYVAFDSSATNLVAGDTNGAEDVFVHDRQTGQTSRVSVDSAGAQGVGGGSGGPSVSADGHYVTFYSGATNLVAGDTNGIWDIFVHDRDADDDGIFDEAGAIATTRVSISSAGAQGDGLSYNSFISADGRYVAFQSDASNLVASDTNGNSDIFVFGYDLSQAPAWPGGSSLSVSGITQTALTLTWTAALDATGVTNYRIYKDGGLIETVGAVTSYDVTGLTAGTAYTFKVEAGDAADNWTTTGPSANTTTQSAGGGGGGGGSGADTQAPATPTGLAAAAGKGKVELSWSANTEPDLAGYNLYRSTTSSVAQATKISSITKGTVSHTDTTALADTVYYYWLSAYDTTGNESAKAGPVSAKPSQGESLFTDVDTSYWAYEYISTLVGKGVVSGYSDGTFRPGATVTRAEFSKMVCLVMGWNLEAPSSPSFTDVSSDAWSYSYIETAKRHGAISGYTDGTFGLNKNITRAEIAKIIAKVLDLPSGTSTLKDIEASWAKDYIEACVKAGIIAGYPDSTFKPNNTATRAEAAKMTVGVLEKK